jgi:hypothetical protein
MTPPALNEPAYDDISPTWTTATSSGGSTTGKEEEGNKERRTETGFFSAGLTPTRQAGIPTGFNVKSGTPPTLPKATNAAVGRSEGNEDEAMPGLEIDPAVARGHYLDTDGLQVKTQYDETDEDLDDEREINEILFGDRHRCHQDEFCMAVMTHGRLCGLHATTCKRHAVKRMNGDLGPNGWYLFDPKTSPRYQTQGRYHLVTSSLETEGDRKAKRVQTFQEMESMVSAKGQGLRADSNEPEPKMPPLVSTVDSMTNP